MGYEKSKLIEIGGMLKLKPQDPDDVMWLMNWSGCT